MTTMAMTLTQRMGHLIEAYNGKATEIPEEILLDGKTKLFSQDLVYKIPNSSNIDKVIADINAKIDEEDAKETILFLLNRIKAISVCEAAGAKYRIDFDYNDFLNRFEIKIDSKDLSEEYKKELEADFIEAYKQVLEEYNLLYNAYRGQQMQIVNNLNSEHIIEAAKFIIATDKVQYLKMNGFSGIENYGTNGIEDDGFGHQNVVFSTIDFTNKAIILSYGNSSD